MSSVSRAERRRQQRAAHKGAQPPRLIIGDGMIAQSIPDEVFDAGLVERTAPLPTKLPGEHRWVIVASYVVTDGDVESMLAGRPSSERQTMGPDQLYHVAIGCIDCEQPAEQVQGKPCPAEAYE